MPELPEVETIRRQLFKKVVGRKIKTVEIRLSKLAYFNGKKSDVKNFKKHTEGTTIKEIDRAAKILVITLSNGYTMLIHLKLTGQLIYRAKNGAFTRGGNPRTERAEQSSYDGHPWPPDSVEVPPYDDCSRFVQELCDWRTKRSPARLLPSRGSALCVRGLPNKWTHAIIHFTDGSKLYFNDLRQFGYLKLLPTEEVTKQKEIQNLGPEPLDESFSVEKFSDMLKKRAKTKIKPLLMDQNFLSGVGNIYADESLFYAGILPTRPAGKIKQPEIKKLLLGLKTILQKSIAQGGTSSDTYVNLAGKKGGYEKYLKVYGREGKPCLRCKTPIKRIKIGSRSAHFCPKCQK